MGFFIALQFLTRLPSPVRREVTVAEMGRSMRWFPTVGVAVGGLVALVDEGLGSITAPEVRSMAALALLIAITGALHLDGLMDSCDALFAYTSPERRLQIMRDSRVGSFAIVGAATVLLLKYAAILALSADSRAASFVAMAALSRWSMVYATVCYPAARCTGLGYAYKSAAGRTELSIATATAFLAALLAGPAGVGAMLVAWLVIVSVARYTMGKIPGLTGDVYGAISEVVEVGVAIALPPLGRLLVIP